ncbi:hypothetical protein [Prevotella pallens]|uniref:hypothetical protein n=1 Tax=Prevotella pallens TaxID=60133 RepID=UPI0015F0B8E8|nr:hypothetical protein [Prevotella pallens]MBF1450357.1 hypothetical protein [Prevotella pallens]MBF1465136.1 hypothetical protein [Prevotella pallens]MBF1478729.1 hypothetical protein [Prevotella pallens]MBF1487577.1 hypothetical protein [Prevotella pallens]MBF1495374.1 hypothetical protein [Prevotella pallens]
MNATKLPLPTTSSSKTNYCHIGTLRASAISSAFSTNRSLPLGDLMLDGLRP